MKLKDWYNFNFIENDIIHVNKVFLKVFRMNTALFTMEVLLSVMKLSKAVELFGNQDIIMVRLEKHEEIISLCICIELDHEDVL